MNTPTRPSGMMTNRSMPPGSIIPELVYDDLDSAVAWLCKTFGFTERLRIGNHRSQLVFGEASVIAVANGQVSASITPGATSMEHPPMDKSHSIMLRVNDVDRHYQYATESGARIVSPPADYPYGERQYSAQDIGGHTWTFSQSIADVDPREWGGELPRNGKAGAGRETILLTELRRSIQGRIITPQDAEFDTARTVFIGGIDRRPAVIVRPADAADVARGIALARESGLELAIRSGGHSSLGHSVTEGGIVVDLSAMRGLEIDPKARTAWAETGLTAGEFTTAAGAHGLVVGFGDTGSVGIGGITLGGGIGYLVRKYGLTIDDLLAAEIATADGDLLYIDAETHPDLFWAIRGGGGNFGVATRFKFRLHKIDRVVGGMLILPATPDIIASLIAEAEAAPEELSIIANVMSAPPMPFLPTEVHGQLIVMALMVYAGDVEAGQRAIDHIRGLATPLADMIRPMHYPEIYPPEDDSYHPTAVGRTMFVNTIDRDVARTIFEYLQASDAVMRVAQLRVLGGAMARVPVEATAFAHRQSRIMVNLAAFYTGAEDKVVREAWVSQFASALRQDDTGMYVNFMNSEEATQIRNAYPGSTWDRLRKVKSRYDPTNLFRLNHNIPPG